MPSFCLYIPCLHPPRPAGFASPAPGPRAAHGGFACRWKAESRKMLFIVILPYTAEKSPFNLSKAWVFSDLSWNSAVMAAGQKGDEALTLLAVLAEFVSLRVPSIHSFLSGFAWLDCWAQPRPLSLVSERPRSNSWAGFTAVQIPVWRGRSGFKNPFCMIGGVHCVPRGNPVLARRELL